MFQLHLLVHYRMPPPPPSLTLRSDYRCIPIGYSNSEIFDSIDAWCKSLELGIETVRKSKNVHTLMYDKVKVYRWYDPQVTDVPARDVSYPPPTVP